MAPLVYRYWNGLCLWNEKGKPPEWGNQVWAGLITARARARLAREIVRVRRAGGRVLYVDTDSIMFTGHGPRYAEKAIRPGEFELRGRFRRALIVGKKEYAVMNDAGKWEAQVKGVPQLERMGYLLNGRASFDRPSRFRESARLGIRANVWSRREKIRRTTLDFRAAPDGTLAVPWISHDGEISFRHDGG